MQKGRGGLAMERSAGDARGNVIQPLSTISLADLLFPPSPPPSSSVTTVLPSPQFSPTLVENSGDDLPSPVSYRIPARSRTIEASNSTRNRIISETVFDSSEEEAEERARIKTLKSQRRKGKGRPSRTSYILDDSEEERINLSVAKPSTSNPIPRAKRRITISIDIDPSSSESDSSSPPLPSVPLRRPLQSTTLSRPARRSKPKSTLQESECICVGDSEEERGGPQSEVVMSLPTEDEIGGTPQSIKEHLDIFATEYDPYAGVLTYEPSHRNPVRFRKNILDVVSPVATPSRVQKSIKKASKRAVIDLTRSSSDESEFVRAQSSTWSEDG